MKGYLEEFKQKKEQKILSYTAYNNLVYKNLNTPKYKQGKEKISIIVPTHNRFEQLTELLNSIFDQTYQNFEIIIIDDLSSDETNEVYSNYHDTRVKYFLNHENLGAGLNRQKGYNLSHGDYIIFCDDDDYYLDNNYFLDLVNIFKNEEINVVFSECYTHFENENKYLHSKINLDEGLVDSIEYLENFSIKYKKPKSTFPAAFRRKTLMEAQFKEMTMMNDTSIYLRALMAGGKTYINKKIIGVYRVHGENITFNIKADFIIRNLEEKRKVRDHLEENKMIPNLDEWYIKQIHITVIYFLKHSDDAKGIDNVLTWVWKNVSYEEYLKYKKLVIKSRGLNLYYYRFSNFGDLLNEDIISSIFKIKFKFATLKNADLSAVGSILHTLLKNIDLEEFDKMPNQYVAAKPVHLWGTGLKYYADHYPDDIKLVPARHYIIHALRGEKTREIMSDILGEDISCVLADPGILAPLLVKPAKKKYKVGLIPHYYDKKQEVFKKMLEHYPNSKIINVQNRPEKVLKEISMCEYVISTSLHGLIVADSYGIPNCWCEISDRVQGKGFKFHDYFSSYGTDRECFDLRTGKIPDLEKDFKCNFKSIDQLHKKQKELVECFPFKLK